MSSKQQTRPHAQDFSKGGRTHQSFKEECDVNHIMAKFEKTAMIEHLNTHAPTYGDFSEMPTNLQGALDQVAAATAMFATVPARVRAEFDNDPVKFVEFVSNPANKDRLSALGLLQGKPSEASDATASGDEPEVASPSGEARDS